MIPSETPILFWLKDEDPVFKKGTFQLKIHIHFPNAYQVPDMVLYTGNAIMGLDIVTHI